MRRIALFAAILMVAPVTAIEANRQSTTWDAEVDITTTSLAPLDGWFIMGTADETTSIGSDVDPDQDTWYLWNLVERVNRDPSWSQKTLGDADPQGCTTVPGLATDCIGHVVAVDLAWEGSSLDGIAYIIASNDDDGNGMLEYYSSQAGRSSTFVAFDGETINDAAISGDGEYVVVATTVLGNNFGQEDTGDLHLFPFEAAMADRSWNRPQSVPVTDVAIDVLDGEGRILAAAGDVVAVELGGIELDDAMGGDVEARFVDLSHEPDQWGVVGFTEGHVNLYASDGQGDYVRKSNDRPDSQDIQAVAISPDGRFYAAGDSTDLFLYNNEFIDLGSPGLLEKATLEGTVRDLAFSHDNRYLVAAAGNEVIFYRVSASGLEEYWNDDFTEPVRHVEVSGDGALVLAVVGNSVYRYESLADATFTGPNTPLAIGPGGAEQTTLTFVNEGNRDVDVVMDSVLPENWGRAFDPAQFTVAPGEQRNIKFTVQAAGNHAAGDEVATAVAKTSVGDFSVDVDVKVLQDRDWNVANNGTINLGIDAGGSATFQVIVENIGNAADETTIVTEVDKEGWSASAQPGTVSLDADGSTTVQILVQAPIDAKELETATITVSPLANPEVQVQLTATVGARFAIGFTGSLEGPLHPDERKGFDLVVLNNGNAPDSVRIAIEGLPKGWDLIFPDGSDPYTVFSLQPAASMTVPVTVVVDDDAEPANYQFRLRATSLGDTSQTQVVTITVAVEEVLEEKPEGNDSPGLPMVALLLVLVGVLVARRR